MNRHNEMQDKHPPAPMDHPGSWWGDILGHMGGVVKWSVVAVIALMLACCAPIVVGAWWSGNADTNTPTLRHPVQVVGPIDSPIQCKPDEWVMSWQGTTDIQYGCTAKWR